MANRCCRSLDESSKCLKYDQIFAKHGDQPDLQSNFHELVRSLSYISFKSLSQTEVQESKRGAHDSR